MSSAETNDLIERLKPTSTTEDRLGAIIQAGIPTLVLADSLGVSGTSVRNWLNGIQPRSNHFQRIDDVRFAMHTLLTQAGMEPGEAVQWLTSRSAEPPHLSPLEAIKDHHDQVVAMTYSLVEQYSHE